MARGTAVQGRLPRLEPEHAPTPRAEARPPSGARPLRARSRSQGSDEARDEARELRAAAAQALARRRVKAKLRALELQLALEDERKRADAYVAEQRARLARLREDERLATLLALREAGVAIGDAIAEVERRFGPRPADRPPVAEAASCATSG